MAREITPKENRFAYMVANGSTQLEAYAKVYGNGQSRATKKSQARVGHEIAKRPVTRAQVIKYQEMLLPIGTMKQEVEFCLRNLKGLACDKMTRFGC
jgi:hypothetical protein